MCGVVGVVSKSHANQKIYDALIVLQHRGQDAAGIATCEGGTLAMHKSTGYVRDVFRKRDMMRLKGGTGIGHVRYPTAGVTTASEAQPLYVNAPFGITLAHNGNIINADALRANITEESYRHINTTSDSEIILNIFADALQQLGKHKIGPDDIFHAVKAVHAKCQGAYACVAMILGYGIVAFRDPHGIRPLVYGSRQTPAGEESIVASETVALDINGFTKVDDVQPGEAIVISSEGVVTRQQCAKQTQLSPCLFEFVYFARPDSFIDGISIYKVRLKLGEYLADKILREHTDHDIDVVIPIPDTSRTAAFSLALALGVKYREGFVKNRYVGRTFIMPGQEERIKSVRHKLNTIALEFQGKNVLLVDDSIVRGTTSKEIVQMAREAGAKKVYFASAAPPVSYPNVYGIDMPCATELISHGRTLDEINKIIGADWLIYQDLQALVDAAREGNDSITRFEDSVFSGDYISGHVDDDYLASLETIRSDGAKAKALAAE